MSKPLITVEPDDTMQDATRIMVDHKIGKLHVVKENKLVGLLTVADFARQLRKTTAFKRMVDAMISYDPYTPE